MADPVLERRSLDAGLYSFQYVQLTVESAGQTARQACRKGGTYGEWSRLDLGMDDKEGSCDKND